MFLFNFFKKKKVSTPHAEVSDSVFNNTFSLQSKILKKHEETNIKNQKRIVELFTQGITVTSEGKLEGPLTTSTTYFMSNGESITIVSPSTLKWTKDILNIKV